MKHWSKVCLVVCLLVGWLIWQRGYLQPVVLANRGADARSFLGLLAQIAATMLGFLLAALAILASITGHRLIRNMQKTGHFKVLLNRCFANIIAYGVSTATALIAYVTNGNLIYGTFLSVVIFLFASLLLIDLGYRFALVLGHLTPDPGP